MKAKVYLIIASLINAVVSWFLFAAILSNVNSATFSDSLLAPYTVLMAVTAGAFSYIGFYRKTFMSNNEFN